MPGFFKAWGPVALWCALIFAFSHHPSHGPDPRQPWWDFLLRKGAHLGEYAVLYLLTARALGWKRAAWALAFCVLYAASDEWHQTFVRGRDGKALDVLLDAAGALLGWLAGRRTRISDRIGP